MEACASKGCTWPFFIRLLFTKALQEEYKDQTVLTILAIDHYTYKNDEVGGHEQDVLPSHQRVSSKTESIN
jgi:hypothetical protein